MGAMMTREDWHRVAEIVSREYIHEPDGVQQEAWNLAVKIIERQLLREGAKVPWADPEEQPRVLSESEL